MKKAVTMLIMIVLSVCCMLSLIGCGFDYTSDTEASKKNLEMLIDRLGECDREGVKTLFAPNRISNIDDFDGDVDELLSYFDGDFVSHDFDMPATIDDIHQGNKKKWFIISANVTTTKSVYRFSMYWCNEDTTDSRNIGIWSLFVFDHADNPLNDFSFYGDSGWDDPNRRGIYIVQPFKYAEMTMNIFESGNVEYIRALFAPQAIDDQTRFNDNVNRLMSFYIGECKSINEKFSDQEIDIAADGKITKFCRKYSYEVETTETKYDVALKFCEKDLNIPHKIIDFAKFPKTILR